MMPARMGFEHAAIGDHVAVHEHEDVVAGGAGAVVARARQPESASLLADHGDVQGRVGRRLRG